MKMYAKAPDGNFYEVQIEGAPGKSAYASACDGGYPGTEGQFNSDLSQVSGKEPAFSVLPVGKGGTGTNALTGARALMTHADGNSIITGTVTSTQLMALTGVTSNIQNQLNGKLDTSATAADSNQWGGKNIAVVPALPSPPDPDTIYFITG